MAELVDDDVVDDGQRSHQALPVEMQVTAFSARRPPVTQILDLNIACLHTNLGREIRRALLNPGQAFGLVESLEHLMGGVLAAAVVNVAQQAPTHRAGIGGAPDGGGYRMVGRGIGEVGPGHRVTGTAQIVQSRPGFEIMDQVSVDMQQADTFAEQLDGVRDPDFVEQRGWLCLRQS